MPVRDFIIATGRHAHCNWQPLSITAWSYCTMGCLYTPLLLCIACQPLCLNAQWSQ